ncbi:DUF6896 domain-containing protein [Hymenobacter yonginensis]|uniref:DUF6896 domain-containing protein n=1 Tax=Hymenobacter yonginensis TaxID=748197 RepID=A0ABY7PUV3_9BACT|nr:hypothetical protein [Hymenobacter yonginensis]WBO86695.1 hypothetical protein O9Z63_20660 [Hymenobacter yonginensis]
MLLQGALSYVSPPPVRLQPLPRLEEDFGCCCWRVGASVLATLTVNSLPDGPLVLGETKAAKLKIADEVRKRLQVGDLLLLGTAQQEAIGQFVIQSLEPDPILARALRPRPGLPVAREPLTASEQQLFTYVEEWVKQADRLCRFLREEFQLDFTRVSRAERTARMGMSGKTKGISFGFHGIGCHFKTKVLELDVDFDSQGDCRGVDLWRIEMFIKWNYPKADLSYTHIKQGISALLQKRWLYQVDRPNDQHFFYVTPTS